MLQVALIVFVFATLASFIQRVSGFGFGIAIMTVLPFLMPSFGEATALSGMLAIVTALLPAMRMLGCVPWRKLIPILITFLAVSFVAVGMLGRVDSIALKKVLGLILILVSLWFLFFSSKVHLPASMSVQVSMGTLSGLMGGLFAMQGPPAVIYFISASKTKEEYIALTQWYFLVGNIMMTFFRAGNGFVTPTVLKLWALAVPDVLAGLWIGGKVYSRIDIGLLRKIVYAFLALAGVIALF